MDTLRDLNKQDLKWVDQMIVPAMLIHTVVSSLFLMKCIISQIIRITARIEEWLGLVKGRGETRNNALPVSWDGAVLDGALWYNKSFKDQQDKVLLVQCPALVKDEEKFPGERKES